MSRYLRCLVIMAILAAGGVAALAAEAVNLLALHSGTLPVVEPAHYGGWPVVGLIDECPASGWASETGTPQAGYSVSWRTM